MNAEAETKTLAEKFLAAERDSAYHYGYQMIKFAKAYHLIASLEDSLAPDLEVGTGYPCDVDFTFIQKPGEPETWKEVYRLLRSQGFKRQSKAEISHGSQMSISLYQFDTKNDTVLSVGIKVSFPECTMEVIGEEIVKVPKYKITCGDVPLVDPFASDTQVDAPPGEQPSDVVESF